MGGGGLFTFIPVRICCECFVPLGFTQKRTFVVCVRLPLFTEEVNSRLKFALLWTGCQCTEVCLFCCWFQQGEFPTQDVIEAKFLSKQTDEIMFEHGHNTYKMHLRKGLQASRRPIILVQLEFHNRFCVRFPVPTPPSSRDVHSLSSLGVCATDSDAEPSGLHESNMEGFFSCFHAKLEIPFSKSVRPVGTAPPLQLLQRFARSWAALGIIV